MTYFALLVIYKGKPSKIYQYNGNDFFTTDRVEIEAMKYGLTKRHPLADYRIVEIKV